MNIENKKIVAITACPTGVAHTFMSATALENKGKKLNVQGGIAHFRVLKC